ncbi:hypothetical protein P154DRAFT_251309 [Amniculicola lignicola CBS 123094]|uniref:Uncharacterized protein n=1 Tax=Amniculicola lignicola CBS 123094 TaxID=1392246 RepID=A0A6A5WC71_9PLEO|nr:hypothetical protein P154DRAFT_251309 [Amniculicola lignicola CBS 123094]
MPLRTRIKRAFTRGSNDENGRKTSKPKKIVDPNVYQPGEKMPPMKYRRPVDPVHKEKLEAFAWTTAWRRKSDHSVYSPMGSRMPSRKASLSTLGRKSIGGRSTRKLSSRGTDIIGVDSGIGGSVVGDGDGAAEGQLKEGSDEEGDVSNVGLSRHPTNDPTSPRRKSSSIRSPSLRSSSITRRSHSFRATSGAGRRSHSFTRPTALKPDVPFSPAELELALERSHLDTHKEESDRSGNTSGKRTPGNAVLMPSNARSARDIERENEEAIESGDDEDEYEDIWQ